MNPAITSSVPAASAGTAALAARPTPAADPRTKAALEEFESVLIGEMINLMLSTVPTDGLMGGGHAEEIYRSMMGQEMGRQIALKGGFGLVPALMDEVIRLQGGQE